MSDPNFIILYVASASASADFYARLLARPPLESSPGFAMFALGSGVMLGLWTRAGVQPEAAVTGGGTELAFALAHDDLVVERHQHWQALGLPIIQPPVRLDFGFTCVGLDPDGHRLRAFAPNAQ